MTRSAYLKTSEKGARERVQQMRALAAPKGEQLLLLYSQDGAQPSVTPLADPITFSDLYLHQEYM